MLSQLIFAAALAATTVSALPAPGDDPSKGSPPVEYGPAPCYDETYFIAAQIVKGPYTFDDYALRRFDTGRGNAVLVADLPRDGAARFYIDRPSHTLAQLDPAVPADQPQYRVALLDGAPYQSDAPPGYRLVALDSIGTQGSSGFGLTHDAGTANFYVGYDGSSAPGFGAFALCRVNGTSPDFAAGPQVQLLWRGQDDAAANYEQCADVALRIEH